MAKNKDLIKSIQAEATTKGVDVPDTNGKNNAQLCQILKDLKSPPAPAPENTQGEAEAEAAATAEAEAEIDEVIKPYSIAPGKSITCKKGVLADGDEIKAEHVAGGEETLDSLVKRGYVVKA